MPSGGMITSPTSDETILPKAAPMTMPTAMSTTLPRMANFLNSWIIDMILFLQLSVDGDELPTGRRLQKRVADPE